MKTIILSIAIIGYSFSTIAQDEQPPIDIYLGTAANFILFTGAGAIANTGISDITGDVGSHAGAIAGFGLPTVLNGTIENTNSTTAQALLDLAAACVQLQNIPATITDHSGIFGSIEGETIYPGVYSNAAAVSITGTLTLDAQGDPDAMFIFKITGALNSVAGATVLLANGASSENVYWIAVGALALGANTTMKGTAIAYPGAVSLGAGSSIDGSLYSTIGAIAVDSTEGTKPTYNTPFGCDINAYLFQDNDVYAIDLASGSSYEIATDITTGNINATGYNPVDGYIWGSLSAPEKTIVRVGKNFNTTSYYIDELPSSDRKIGDVSADGIYYLKGEDTTYYKIDLDPSSANFAQHQSTESLSQNISIDDWAFNAVDGNLYAIEKISNILYRIDPSDGNVQTMGEVPILSGSTYTYDAVYFDVDGRFYISTSEIGTIFVVQNVQDLEGSNPIDSNLFAFGPSSSNSDGARCPTALVAQEICDNGTDDDGDGLIDCEDPSCSGFGSCPIIESNISGGNDGGLESNNRLSDKISQRNYNRAKINYRFDRGVARRVSKSSNYAKRSPNSNFQLQNFIPLTVINEDYVIDSTPIDLLGITNAVDVYSVDYIKNEESIASVLALKTENGVYEHTKYICDRLLGAELISVSTMEINGHSFIKSIIRNTDNSIEFVLSLSAKITDNEQSFSIESHWNIDQYEKNITFYNFQIWSNSIDNLLLLGQEVLDLLDIEKPISDYNNSTPPSVFVRKGKYFNGNLKLQIVNTNASETISFTAGLRQTETSTVENMTSSIDLNKDYIIDLEFPTGSLFDIGFRISDGLATPDDLFMSDGPWGYDDSAVSSNITAFLIEPNRIIFEADEFPVERNVSLKAVTSEYVAVYRALTPRFNPVNLSDFNSLKLNAKGTGSLQITFVKKSILKWEDQYKTTIELTDEIQDFHISFSDIQSKLESELVLDDLVTIVFTMVSENGELVAKGMTLEAIRFSVENNEMTTSNDFNKLQAIPNPMGSNTSIYFASNQSEDIMFMVYDQTGKLVLQNNFKTSIGKNQLIFNRQSLKSGLYICLIKNSINNYNPLKLLVK